VFFTDLPWITLCAESSTIDPVNERGMPAATDRNGGDAGRDR
jgi:hypothetical protein